jgi:hypothetical protein
LGIPFTFFATNTSLSLNFHTIIMLSIKNSLASVLLLASYAAAQSAPGQSAINLEVKYCSKGNTGSSNAQGTSALTSK